MKSEASRPIPIPLAQRLRHARMNLLPTLVFGGAICALSVLWRYYIAPPSMTGQVETVVANVSSHLPGVLAGLNVQRFQSVRAGDALGHVITADPKLLEASLAVVRSELEMMRVTQDPIAAQQRNAVNYAQLRIDWMRQRVELANARVDLQLAEAEFRRTEELFKSNVASASEMDIARAARDAQHQQVEELVKLVADGEQSFKNLQAAKGGEMFQLTDDPMRATVAAYEAQLHQIEAELAPVLLRAPTDGVVSAVYFRSGESVTAGMPIVSIASAQATRIIGYLRPPFREEPKPGMKVEVRVRGIQRVVGTAEIVQVGAQLEPLPLPLQNPFRPAGSELALTLDIGLPANLPVRPGELVDIRIVDDPE
jgi:multidrug resistance efflux pump